eukprot:scaffold3738_cov129-Isochrysis_galbana.AAC.2
MAPTYVLPIWQNIEGGLPSSHRRKRNSASAWRAEQCRPDNSCWSWRRSTWPRRKARKESALIAQMILQCRYDCQPERPPAPPA